MKGDWNAKGFQGKGWGNSAAATWGSYGPQQNGGQWSKGRGLNAFETDFEEEGELSAHEMVKV